MGKNLPCSRLVGHAGRTRHDALPDRSVSPGVTPVDAPHRARACGLRCTVRLSPYTSCLRRATLEVGLVPVGAPPSTALSGYAPTRPACAAPSSSRSGSHPSTPRRLLRCRAVLLRVLPAPRHPPRGRAGRRAAVTYRSSQKRVNNDTGPPRRKRISHCRNRENAFMEKDKRVRERSWEVWSKGGAELTVLPAARTNCAGRPI